MKIAVCLSGHLRSYKQNIQNLCNNLLSNQKAQFDVFVHTWNQIDRNGVKIKDQDVVNAYNPKKMIIEAQRQFPVTKLMQSKNVNMRDINGVLSMFYNIKECNRLKTQYEQQYKFTYDGVIRIRPDISLHTRPPVESIDFKKLHIPKYGDYGGLNDQFAYSNSHNMDLYCSTFDHIEEYLNKGLVFNPEFFTLETIRKYDLPIERPEINYDIIHYNGKVWNNLTRHPGWV